MEPIVYGELGISKADKDAIAHLENPFWNQAQPAPGPWDTLPYERIGGLGFERLCFHILVAHGHVPRYFGTNGQAQYGIDLICGNGLCCTVYQCKNVKQIRMHHLESWLKHFESNWLSGNVHGLIRPEKFVLFCPIDLRQREELENAKSEFAKRTGIGVEIQDRNVIDAILRTRPDIVADVFGDQAAERYCDVRSWNSGLFRALLPGSGDKLIIDRFLELEAKNHIVHDTAIAERFFRLFEQRRHVLLLGPSGSGKTTTALALARNLGVRCQRIFVVSDWVDTAEDIVVDGIKARTTRPTIFLLDDVHKDFEKAGRIMRRSLYACRDRPIGLILTAHSGRQEEEQAIDPEAELIEECLENETVIHLVPNEQTFKAIIQRVRPDLASLSQPEIQRMWALTAGDLALLQYVLEMIKSPECPEQIDLDELLDLTLKRYFGRKNIDARNLEHLAAIAQFDVPVQVGWLDNPIEYKHQPAIKRLIVEDGRPLAYRFVHRALAELLFMALCRAHGHLDPINVAVVHADKVLGSESMTWRTRRGQVLKSMLNTRLRLMDHGLFRRRLLSESRTMDLVAALTGEEKFRLLSFATQLTSSAESGGTYRRMLGEALVAASTEPQSLSAYTFVDALVQLLPIVRHIDAERTEQIEHQIGAGNLVRLIRQNGTVFDLLKIIRHGSVRFTADLLNRMDESAVQALVDNTLSARRSISTIHLRMQGFAGHIMPDGRSKLEHFEQKLGAEHMLRLICLNGTLVDLLKGLQNASERFASAMIVGLDDGMVDELVDRNICVGRSIGTVGLALRDLRKRKLSDGRSQLEMLENKLSVGHMLRLIRSNGTVIELLNILQNSSVARARAMLKELDQPTANDLVEKTIGAMRSIGTCNLSIRHLRHHAVESLQHLFAMIGVAGWWRLLLNNGDMDDLARILQDVPTSIREQLLSSAARLTPEAWRGMVERSSFQAISGFMYYNIMTFPSDARGSLDAALLNGADSAAQRANWHGIAKGLAVLENVAISPCRDGLRRAAFARFDGMLLQEVSFEDLDEAINFVHCVWRERPKRRPEIASRLWSLLPDTNQWRRDPRTIVSARFLLRICCDQIVNEADAVKVLRVVAELLVRLPLGDVHSTPACLFIWNLYALWFERGREVAGTFEALAPQSFWDDAIRVTGERLRKRGTRQDRIDHLALAGALVVLIPATRDRIRVRLQGAVTDVKELERNVSQLSFLSAYFAYHALALVAPVQRTVFNERKRQLRKKLEMYEDIGPALASLAASL
ncbi:AAA family ATPase [Sorangium sp. So ce363]|uniref:AAA family ATPase n=1 Tax=Sorangium sp. So ce363 TaxID=3133304 RepID=UPI003F6376F6